MRIVWHWALMGVIAAACAERASAGIIFSENFESYAPGSNIVGQGGWVADPAVPSSVGTVNPGTFLPTKVLDGRAPTGPGQQNIVNHELSIDPNAITTLTFDAYASTIPTASRNADVFFRQAGSGTNQALWHTETAAHLGGPKWSLIVDAGFHVTFDVPGGYDTPVRMGIVLDGIADEIYGLYDFGGGFLETPHYAVDPARLAMFDTVQILADHRSGVNGMEVDNILVVDNNAVPEPASWLLLTIGACGSAWVVRRAKSRGDRG
jgi:hypothetical protein